MSLKHIGAACIILLSFLCAFPAEETQTNEFHIQFRVNSSKVEPSLFDNAAQINGAIKFLKEVKDNPKIEIESVAFCGTASPEGPYELNRELARQRLKAIEDLVLGQVNVPASKITVDDTYIPWNWLKDQVAKSDIADKEAVIAIIDSKPSMVSFAGNGRTIDNRINKLKALDGGKPWREMFNRFFSQMRMGTAVIVTVREIPEPEPKPEPRPRPYIEEPQEPVEEVVAVEEEVVVVEEPVDDWYRKMYIKTNAPAWAMLWQNLAVEFDLAKHWSFALPVYWSPYNYGKQTIKFRTLAFVPEFRWWPKADNTGFFLNAHFGLAYYNFAANGDYRYQDHDGKTPAIGGGIGLGYRFYFCRNHHWSMEVALGAGVYKLDYDKFLNTGSTKHGYLVDRVKKTFYGIDQAALTFSYSFGLRKKVNK